jgi:hypothetical protein
MWKGVLVPFDPEEPEDADRRGTGQFMNAATVWFDFAAGQEFKIAAKVIGVLKDLPANHPGITAPTLANGKSQRTIERHLEILYEAGLACRQQITAPGMPWGYWCDEQTRQSEMSLLSEMPTDTESENVA